MSNNIRTTNIDLSNILTDLIDSEIPTSEIEMTIILLKQAMNVRNLISVAEHRHQLLVDAMTSDEGVTAEHARDLIANYNYICDVVAERTKDFHDNHLVRIDLVALDEMMSELLGK